ncbi:hypothetical protein ACUKBL_06800 [Furfurilactobacillus rossiae]
MAKKLATRAEVPDELKWNLKDLYPSDDAFDDAVVAYKNQLGEFGQYEGHVTDSAKKLYAVVVDAVKLSGMFGRIYFYASARNDSDTTDRLERNWLVRRSHCSRKRKVQLVFYTLKLRLFLKQPLHNFCKMNHV